MSVAALNSYICCHLWACKRDMTDLRLIILGGLICLKLGEIVSRWVVTGLG